MGPLQGVRVPRKLIGCIEQAICAAARRFFGTKHSTFSQYVFRLRGYYPAADTREYWHNYQYTGFAEVDKLAQPDKQGRSYFVENKIVLVVLDLLTSAISLWTETMSNYQFSVRVENRELL